MEEEFYVRFLCILTCLNFELVIGIQKAQVWTELLSAPPLEFFCAI